MFTNLEGLLPLVILLMPLRRPSQIGISRWRIIATIVSSNASTRLENVLTPMLFLSSSPWKAGNDSCWLKHLVKSSTSWLWRHWCRNGFKLSKAHFLWTTPLWGIVWFNSSWLVPWLSPLWYSLSPSYWSVLLVQCMSLSSVIFGEISRNTFVTRSIKGNRNLSPPLSSFTYYLPLTLYYV